VGVKVLGDDERVFRDFMSDIFAAADDANVAPSEPSSISESSIRRIADGAPSRINSKSFARPERFRAKWVPVRG
jgi:hypothetical protein